MREIKFRAWIVDKRTMSKPFTLVDVNVESEDFPGFYSLMGKDIYPLMQYTGLKDKNGKDIYEGDIVRWIKREPVEGKHLLLMTTSVTFFNGGFVPFTDSAYNMKYEECEVIGNIYENPELLK